MFCTKCGAKFPDGTQFCTVCGNTLNAPAAPVEAPAAVPEPVEQTAAPVSGTVCPACGASLPEGQRFCTSCGASVNAAPAVPAAAAEQKPAPVAEPVEEVVPPVSGTVCTACGASLPKGQKFCTNCGSAVIATPAQPEIVPNQQPTAKPEDIVPPVLNSVCPNCGAALPEGKNFCTNCGTNVGAFTAGNASAQPPMSKKEQKKLEKQQKAQLKAEKKAGKPKKKTWKIVLIIVLVLALIAGGVVGFLFYNWETTYKKALKLRDESKYGEAIEKLEELDGYKDSETILGELTAKYDEANALIAEKKYDEAAALLEMLSGYEDSDEILDSLQDQKASYDKANALLSENDFSGAKAAFKELGDYADSAEMVESGVDYQYALCLVDWASDEKDIVRYEEAAEIFQSLGDYRDSEKNFNDCYYNAAVILMENGDYDSALAYCDLVDEETADKIYQNYANDCADSNVWDTIMEASDLIPDGSVNAAYKEGLAAQIEILKPLGFEMYENPLLKELVNQLVGYLEEELTLFDKDGNVTDWPAWYTNVSYQQYTIADIAENLELDESLITSLNETGDVYTAYAAVEKVLKKSLNEEAKETNEDYGYYLEVKNTSGYGFKLNYTVTWYQDDKEITTTEAQTITVDNGKTVTVPLYYPSDKEANRYVITWDSDTLTKDGKLLPGQD